MVGTNNELASTQNIRFGSALHHDPDRAGLKRVTGKIGVLLDFGRSLKKNFLR
jgi:hypothetical protein